MTDSDRPYISLGDTDRPLAEEHHDAMQLLVIDVLRKFTGTIIDAASKASYAHEMLAVQEILNKAYFAPLDGQLRLMGHAEVATHLGVSRARVAGLATTRPKGFPPPVARLSCGPVWLAQDIERFASTWDHKPGRPKKDRKEE